MRKLENVCIVPNCGESVRAGHDLCNDHFQVLPLKIRTQLRLLAKSLDALEITEYTYRRLAEDVLSSMPPHRLNLDNVR